jgi:hypothetical protein
MPSLARRQRQTGKAELQQLQTPLLTQLQVATRRPGRRQKGLPSWQQGRQQRLVRLVRLRSSSAWPSLLMLSLRR